MEDHKSVNFTYSAEEQKELNAIRAKYLPKEKGQPTHLDKIKKLDARVESRAMIVGISVGILSTLVMGGGMSLVLSLGQTVPGIVVGFLGLAGMGAAWPLYNRTLKKEREKAAPEILRLSGEQK